MKKLLTGSLIAASLLMTTTLASAHDGWSETKAPIVQKGNSTYVDLLLGNHTNGHKSFRIDAKWDFTTAKLFVTNPKGEKTDITSTVKYAGEEKEVDKSRLGVNNFYTGSFISNVYGAHIITAESDSVGSHGGPASRTMRSAKSFVAVTDLAVADRAATLKGFQKQVTPDRGELIPMFNPTTVKPTDKITVQLLVKGKPVANTNVDLVRRSTGEAQTFATNEFGKVTFTLVGADYYLIRTKPSMPDKEVGKYESTNYEATMTFQAQANELALPQTADKMPIVTLNGTPYQLPEISTWKNGSLYVPTFVIQDFDPTFADGRPVDFVATMQKLGYKVDVLGQVGEIAPQIVLYK